MNNNNNNKDICKKAKLHSGALYGKTVLSLFQKQLQVCKHCRHFNIDELKCDKKHHCDCDCPDCSPESYI